MNLKTYKAATMAQALALVKKELGSDAVILHTRHYKQGGVMGFGAKTIVEITAGPASQVGRRRRMQGGAAVGQTTSRAGRSLTPSRKPVAANVNAEQATAGDLIRKTYAAAQAQFTQKQAEEKQVEKTSAQANRSFNTTMVGPGQQGLAEEVAQIKKLVEQMYRAQQAENPHANPFAAAASSDELLDQYLSLIQHEVAKELAQEVVDSARLACGDGANQEMTIAQAVRKTIAQMLPIDRAAEQLKDAADGRPRTIALVGPTGVGKTTTIAKLAATFKLKQNKTVGLITMDTYRIAAVDQLRTYAQIIGVDLHVASNEQELNQAIFQTRDCDVVLIDTAGRSQKDDPRLEQLTQLIQVANPHEVHLVLSATSGENVLFNIAEKFSQIRYDRIIFTKLDEAVNYGVLLNVAKRVNKQLSYLTTGQEVPHQIEPTQAQRIADLVMGGKL